MRNVLLAFAGVAALSSVAAADPLAVAATPATAAPEPTTYVLGGLMAGGNDDLLTAGGTAEVGMRVVPNVWAHASVTAGAATELFAHGNGSITQARAGMDLMPCVRGGALCMFVGADLGVQASHFQGTEDDLFCDSDCMGTPVDYHHSGTIGVGRVGVDLGGKHFRVRSGIEASRSTDGYAGLNLTQSIAWRF